MFVVVLVFIWLWVFRIFLQNTFWNVKQNSITSIMLPLKEAVLQTKYYSSKAMLLNDNSSSSQSSNKSPWSCCTNRPIIFHSVLLISTLQKTEFCKRLEASHKWPAHPLTRSGVLLQTTAFVLSTRKNASSLQTFSPKLQYVAHYGREVL